MNSTEFNILCVGLTDDQQVAVELERQARSLASWVRRIPMKSLQAMSEVMAARFPHIEMTPAPSVVFCLRRLSCMNSF